MVGYSCDLCGAGPFERPNHLANHRDSLRCRYLRRQRGLAGSAFADRVDNVKRAIDRRTGDLQGWLEDNVRRQLAVRPGARVGFVPFGRLPHRRAVVSSDVFAVAAVLRRRLGARCTASPRAMAAIAATSLLWTDRWADVVRVPTAPATPAYIAGLRKRVLAETAAGNQIVNTHIRGTCSKSFLTVRTRAGAAVQSRAGFQLWRAALVVLVLGGRASLSNNRMPRLSGRASFGRCTGRGGRARSRIAVAASLFLKARGAELNRKVDALMALVAEVCVRAKDAADMLAAGESWAVVADAIAGAGLPRDGCVIKFVPLLMEVLRLRPAAWFDEPAGTGFSLLLLKPRPPRSFAASCCLACRARSAAGELVASRRVVSSLGAARSQMALLWSRVFRSRGLRSRGLRPLIAARPSFLKFINVFVLSLGFT